MMRNIGVALALVVFAMSAEAQSTSDETAVRAVVQAIENSLNARDWHAFASMFSQEGDLILFDSRRAAGPAGVQRLISDRWADTPADVRARLTPATLRFVTPQVAIMTVDGDFSGSVPSKDRAIFVVSDRDGQWRLEALRVFNAEMK